MALPIQRLAPLSTHSSPSRRAVVSMPPATSEPPCGSVSANAPIFSNRLIAGSQRRFCSSEPQVRMLPIASPLCTPKNTDSDGSACAISIAVMPVSRLLGAGSDESGSAQSSRPSLRESLDEFERELGPCPVVIDDRRSLRAEEFAYPVDLLALRIRQQFLVGVEIGRQQPASQIGLPRSSATSL